MGKWQHIRKNRRDESQKISPFPAGDHKADRNRQDSMAKTNINNKKDPQKKHGLGTVRKLLECLNMFHGTNITLNSDVDQETYMFGSHERSLTYP